MDSTFILGQTYTPISIRGASSAAAFILSGQLSTAVSAAVSAAVSTPVQNSTTVPIRGGIGASASAASILSVDFNPCLLYTSPSPRDS